MPCTPSVSPATNNPTKPYFIHTLDGNFVDNNGRTLLLRGVNLSGSSKAPSGDPSHYRDALWEAGEGGKRSFIGRPFSLEDGSADVHLARLKGWGFNMLRFPVTWEALEHEGPGKYDYDFMDFTISLLRKCKEYGFRLFIDPHQDVWSRYSGGSGAPYWTLIACGMNPHNFTATQGALLHSEYPVAKRPDPESFPAMIWSTNYGRLVSQTMFTLFFAGKDYAPKCVIDGMNIQDYLQSHFIAAFGALADRIRDAGDLFDECIIGWDSINEPAEGLCGYEDLNVVQEEQGSTFRKGSRPTPAQSLRLGMGQVQTVDHWDFGTFGPRKDGTVTIDPKGRKLWLDPEAEVDGYNERWGWKRDNGWELGTCIWALHGVWDVSSGEILKPSYFRSPPFDPVRSVVFGLDYWRPHWRAYAARIRRAHPEAILFIEPPVFAQPPPLEKDDLSGRCCYSPHYYDGFTLVTRHWSWFNADALGLLRGMYKATWMAVKFGERAIRQSLQGQLGILKDDTNILGPYPTIIGEIGTPFDMDGKRSYGWTDGGKYKGDYSRQERALDASLNAADGPNALNYTIWTYCPDSTHKWGDGWNLEDLSLWSADDLRPLPPREDFGFRSAYNSKVALKNHPPQPIVRVKLCELPRSVAASAITLNALSGISAAAEAEQAVNEDVSNVMNILKSPITRLHWSNDFDFLTDGARAVRAFSRPYPVAVVGLPKNISFDLAKAEFKLTVKVRPEDRPVLVSSGDGSRSLRDIHKDDSSELPTEIYVPLVHYAEQNLIAQSIAGHVQTETENEEDPAPITQITGSNETLLARALVDIDVQVSAGHWSVEGQYLRWWYPVPTEGSRDVEYTICILRKGGPIRLQDELAQNSDSSCLMQLCERLTSWCSGVSRN